MSEDFASSSEPALPATATVEPDMTRKDSETRLPRESPDRPRRVHDGVQSSSAGSSCTDTTIDGAKSVDPCEVPHVVKGRKIRLIKVHERHNTE